MVASKDRRGFNKQILFQLIRLLKYYTATICKSSYDHVQELVPIGIFQKTDVPLRAVDFFELEEKTLADAHSVHNVHNDRRDVNVQPVLVRSFVAECSSERLCAHNALEPFAASGVKSQNNSTQNVHKL